MQCRRLLSRAARPLQRARGWIAPGTTFTVFGASITTRPTPVRGADGQLHLAYELLLTNTTSLARIDVREASSGSCCCRSAAPVDETLNPVGSSRSPRRPARRSPAPSQVLGLFGTSGNSTTPHLHLQVMTTRFLFPTESPPYVFARFELLGQITERIWDDDLGLQATPVLPYEAAADAGPRRNQLPLDRNVIRFGS